MTCSILPRLAAAVLTAVVLAGVVLPASAMQAPPPAPPPPAPSTAPATSPPDIGTLRSRLEHAEGDFILRLYRATLRERFETEAREAKQRGAPVESAGKRLREAMAAMASGSPVHWEGVLSQGKFAGTWTFEQFGDGAPDRAWRDIDRSTDAGYSSERIGYCSSTPEDCGDWFESGRQRSRRPEVAGGPALAQWQQRVMREPCEARPELRPSTKPLERALIRSGRTSAEVQLIVLLNPCGDVREVTFASGSRDRDLDLAVMHWAYRARFATQARNFGNGLGGFGMIPFRFSRED
jgi:hypothetical protein